MGFHDLHQKNSKRRKVKSPVLDEEQKYFFNQIQNSGGADYVFHKNV